MRRLPPSRLAAPAATLLALLFAACGGGDEGRPLPARASDALVAELEQVERRVAAGECDEARAKNLPRVKRQIDRLPDNVDPDVRATLEDGSDRLVQLVEEQCVQKEDEPVETETTPEPEPTAPEPTEPAPTEPEPEEPKPEKPKPEKPKPEKPEKPEKPDESSGGTPVPGSDDGGDAGGGKESRTAGAAKKQGGDADRDRQRGAAQAAGGDEPAGDDEAAR